MNFVRTTDPSMAAFETIHAALNAAFSAQKDAHMKLDALDLHASAPKLPTVDEILEHVLDVEARIKD